MKFNLFKMAKSAQKALDAADDIDTILTSAAPANNHLSAHADNTPMSGKTRAKEMLRAALNGDWFDLAKLGFDALLNLATQSPMPFDDYLSAISQYVDVKIQQFSMEENLKFIGGECHLSVDSAAKSVQSKVQLYFKNENNKWIMKQITGNTAFKCFDAAALNNEITDIMNQGGRKIPVTPPAE